MRAGRRQWLIVSSVVLATALTAAWLLVPRGFGPLALPSPNGYEDFLAAAHALRDEETIGREYESELILQALVVTNQEAYEFVRTGLTKSCLVPIRMNHSYPAANTKHRERLKLLTHYMVARAELARRQGRTAEAAEGFGEAYALATRIGQGGLMVDFLTQIGCQGIVLHHFHFRCLVSELAPEQCSGMLNVLLEAENGAEDWRAVSARQARWDRAVFSPRERMAHFRSRLVVALRDRSWRHLRGDASVLRDLETKHREEVLRVISVLRAHSAGVKAEPG